MRVISAKRKWKCDECGEVYDHQWDAEECWKSHQYNHPDITPISVCGCGAEYIGHSDESCPECKRTMDLYLAMLKEKTA